MKTIPFRLTAVIGFALLVCRFSATADAITNTVTYTPGAVIPDNDPNGISDTHNFSSSIQSITDIQITLDISGGYNGDYYAFLRHGTSGFAVLLNRVGATVGNTSGSSDSGFSIILNDAASLDVHGASAGGGTLTGIWQPDGRNIDPQLSLDTTQRNALLNVFNGTSASGDWTLFVADTSAVGIGTLQDWTLSVVGTAVPEPGVASLLLLGGLTLGAFLLRRRA